MVGTPELIDRKGASGGDASFDEPPSSPTPAMMIVVVMVMIVMVVIVIVTVIIMRFFHGGGRAPGGRDPAGRHRHCLRQPRKAKTEAAKRSGGPQNLCKSTHVFIPIHSIFRSDRFNLIDKNMLKLLILERFQSLQ